MELRDPNNPHPRESPEWQRHNERWRAKIESSGLPVPRATAEGIGAALPRRDAPVPREHPGLWRRLAGWLSTRAR